MKRHYAEEKNTTADRYFKGNGFKRENFNEKTEERI